MSNIAHPAYIGSKINTISLVATLTGHNNLVSPRLQAAASELLTRLGTAAPDPVSGALQMISCANSLEARHMENILKRAQAWLQEAVDSRIWTKLHAQAASQERERLEACRRPHAGAWLSAFPCRALGLWMPPCEFVVSAKLWLGVIDKQDTKALRRTGYGMYDRHHAIRDVIYDTGNAARLRPHKEAAVDTSGKRPADIFFPN